MFLSFFPFQAYKNIQKKKKTVYERGLFGCRIIFSLNNWVYNQSKADNISANVS